MDSAMLTTGHMRWPALRHLQWGLLAVLPLILVACGDDEQEDSDCRNGMAAFAAATDIARGRLALPPLASSASESVQIPGGRSEYLGDCRHRVVSYVERGNLPGETAEPDRQRFEATVRLSGDDWLMDSISFY